MVLSKKLNRSIKARREEDSDLDPHSSEIDISSPSVLDTGDAEGDIRSSGDEDELDDQDGELSEESGEESENGDVQDRLSKVSFGALAKAQSALKQDTGNNRKRKRDTDPSDQQEDKLRALRQRLEELKSRKTSRDSYPAKRNAKQRSPDDSAEEEDSDDSNSSDDDGPKGRSSKHAPAAQTSKKPVTRRRNVLDVHKAASRDPRFDALSAPLKNNDAISKKYSFLKDYRATEISALKTAMVKTKDPAQKEILKNQIKSMESRAKSQAAKDKQQEVIREHRKKEKEAIAQGKKPFYLKKKDAKQQALIEQFNSMSGKQRDRAIQRRRKKLSGREKKQMPALRRTA